MSTLLPMESVGCRTAHSPPGFTPTSNRDAYDDDRHQHHCCGNQPRMIAKPTKLKAIVGFRRYPAGCDYSDDNSKKHVHRTRKTLPLDRACWKIRGVC